MAYLTTSLGIKYNKEKSEDYGITVASINTAPYNYTFGMNYDVNYEKLKYIDKVIYYNVDKLPLQFTLELFKEHAWTDIERQEIAGWLYREQFKELEFYNDSNDIDGNIRETIIFNCMPIGEAKTIDLGGLYGIEITFLCDRPYAYKKILQEFDLSLSSSTQTVQLINDSYYNNYIYNIDLDITLVGSATSISITNQSDGGRVFAFTGLNTGESITIKNQENIITSDKSSNRLPNFNKNWFRLVRGINHLSITGNVIVNITGEYPIIL